LQSQLEHVKKDNEEKQMDFKKKLSSLEAIVNNQIKMKSEESFSNYFDMNGGEMRLSVINKQRPSNFDFDKDESVIHELGVLDGLINSNNKMSNIHPIKSNQPLTAINEIGESQTTSTGPPVLPEQLPLNSAKNNNIEEVTGNSFFNDISLPHNLTKNNSPFPSTMNKNNQVIKRESPETNKSQKIKREHVKNDLNCTLNDASVLEYMVDQDGYLLDHDGNPVYNDFGKMVKLTDDQIENFKENDLYEEMNI
jgi:hypothetical protein